MVASVPLFTMRTFSIEGTQCADRSRHLDFERIRNAEADPARGRLVDGLDHHVRRMPENGRTPSADVVDVLLAIHVPDVGAFRALDEKWFAADTAKGAHGRIHAARDTGASAGEELR